MGKTALITGASAGLGRDFARLFAADGHDVVLVARRRERLDELAGELTATHGVAAHVMAEDLGDQEAPRRLLDECAKREIAVEFLVNNAGFGSNGAFAALDPSRELQMIDVNVTALVHLSRLFLPQMLERGSGRILNIGSLAGFQAGPYMATYYATKAFVNHFSEALAVEVADQGVTVTVSCPGPVATEFGGIAGNDQARMFKGGGARSVDIAREAYDAMMKGKRMIVHGFKNRMAVQALRVSPRGAIHRIAAKLNKPD